MSDVIERLLEVEKNARKIIAEGERKAAETVSQAHDEARRIIDESRQKARREADELVEREIDALEERKKQRIGEESGKFRSADDISPDKLKEAVDFIVNAIAYGAEGQDQEHLTRQR